MDSAPPAEKFSIQGTEWEFWCVLVGNAAIQVEAETLANAVRQSDPDFRSAFVVHASR